MPRCILPSAKPKELKTESRTKFELAHVRKNLSKLGSSLT